MMIIASDIQHHISLVLTFYNSKLWESLRNTYMHFFILADTLILITLWKKQININTHNATKIDTTIHIPQTWE